MTPDTRAPAGAQETWELIRDPLVSQLVFAYEMVLTEMRTYAKAGDRTIAEWVRRLDFERDEFVNQMLAPQPQPDRAALAERLESAANYLAGYADLVKIGGKTKWGDFPEDPEIRAAHYGSDKLFVVEARLREAARALSAPDEATEPEVNEAMQSKCPKCGGVFVATRATTGVRSCQVCGWVNKEATTENQRRRAEATERPAQEEP